MSTLLPTVRSIQVYDQNLLSNCCPTHTDTLECEDVDFQEHYMRQSYMIMLLLERC